MVAAKEEESCFSSPNAEKALDESKAYISKQCLSSEKPAPGMEAYLMLVSCGEKGFSAASSPLARVSVVVFAPLEFEFLAVCITTCCPHA
jgi:hypothetical protein